MNNIYKYNNNNYKFIIHSFCRFLPLDTKLIGILTYLRLRRSSPTLRKLSVPLIQKS